MARWQLSQPSPSSCATHRLLSQVGQRLVPHPGGRRHLDGALRAAVVCRAGHQREPLHTVQGAVVGLLNNNMRVGLWMAAWWQVWKLLYVCGAYPNPCPNPALAHLLAGHDGRPTARMSSEHVAPQLQSYLLSHSRVHI